MVSLNSTAPAVKADRSSDSSHYYAHDAAGWRPLYTPEKNYTLREARKDQAAGLAVVPSVTTYFKCLHKQMLLDWKMQQVAKACYAAASNEEDRGFNTEDDYVDAMVSRADNASKGAADLGTRIHAADEAAHRGEDYDADLDAYVQACNAARKELGVVTIARETPCGSLAHGYAGKCDEHGEGMTVLDLKSRKSGKQKTPKVASYSTDRLQLAGYGYALFGIEFFTRGRGIILAVSTTTPGLVTPHVFSGPELLPAWSAYQGLMAVWRFENNFDPRVLT